MVSHDATVAKRDPVEHDGPSCRSHMLDPDGAFDRDQESVGGIPWAEKLGPVIAVYPAAARCDRSLEVGRKPRCYPVEGLQQGLSHGADP